MMVNGIYVVQNECCACVALLRKTHKGWAQHEPSPEDNDPLLRNFADLRDVLLSVNDLSEVNPDTFLSPFLEVVKADTSGPVTAQALTSVGKFIDFGLVDMHAMKTANAVETIAEAITRTKFIASDKGTGSDECVLLTILLTLRTLMLSPAGRQLSDESVCALMQTCIRIAFSEIPVSEILRKMAESTLADIAKLLFTRLPTFTEDISHPYIRKCMMKATNAKRRKRRSKNMEEVREDPKAEIVLSKDAAVHCDQICSPDEQVICSTASPEETRPTENEETDALIEKSDDIVVVRVDHESQYVKEEKIDEGDLPDNESSSTSDTERSTAPRHRVNDRGVKFSTEYDAAALGRNMNAPGATRASAHTPYGLPCVRELLRFLSAQVNPQERTKTEEVTLALNLLTVAIEAGADYLHGYSTLLSLVKNDLCRALIQNLDSEKLPIFAAASRVCFLLFEALRTNLKFQLESYFLKLKAIINSDQMRVSYEHKEMALESLVNLWRIPGLVTELYLNYDCDLYCTNLFEDLTKLLMERAFPVVGLRSTNILSLDALLTVIDTIDLNCLSRSEQFVGPPVDATDASKVAFQMAAQQAQQTQVRPNRMPVSESMPSMSEVIERKKKKKVISEATEKYNQNPKMGIEFLMERGILKTPLDALDVATWLRSNPRLDKKKIADHICSRKHADVLEYFVKSFPFDNTRLDVALRMFLETFRLPGESPLIEMVMQHFAAHWFEANGEPFNHVDAAFTLAYAVIMLNTDQHNKQVRRNQQPMTIDCFKRNLSGTNGNADFDPDMLEQIFHAIKSDEIVMPAEQTGLVKENYLWKVLLRRGETPEGEFLHAPVGWNDHDLFGIVWGSVAAALSYVFEKSEQDRILVKSLNGFRKCATVAAHYGMSDVFDNLVICLCKFSSLMGSGDNLHDRNELYRTASMNDTSLLSMADGVAIAYGENSKAQMATKALFEQVHLHGDILRDGWKNVLECLLHLFHARLLPDALTEVEDFVDTKKWVSILRDHSKNVIHNKNDSGLLSWFGLGGSSTDSKESKKPTQEQEELMKNARAVISECKPEQLIKDGKYLTSSALTELMNSIYAASSVIRGSPSTKTPKKLSEQDEDSIIFYLEFMISVAIENKDRLSVIWPVVHRHLQWLTKDFGQNPLVIERAVVGLLRLASRVLYHLKDKDEDVIADDVLQSLSMLLSLKPQAMFMFSRQIAFGLHDLLQANAANVHRSNHWALIFSIMEAAGAAAYTDDNMDSPSVADKSRLVQSDSEQVDQAVVVEDRGYTSDDPALLQKQNLRHQVSASLSSVKSTSNEWIQVGHDHEASSLAQGSTTDPAISDAPSPKIFERGTIVLVPNLSRHEPAAFLRIGDTMAFLARDSAHITPENFESCVKCLRSLIEASLDGGKYAAGPLNNDAHNQLKSASNKPKTTKPVKVKRPALSVNDSASGEEAEQVEEEESQQNQFSVRYYHMSLQLLDLCFTLHMKASPLYSSWKTGASANSLWNTCWKPLLQALARLSSDCRRNVRSAALGFLTRALLIPELQEMNSSCWESCFAEVVFPMLAKLLDNFAHMDPLGLEETRFRAIQLVSKTLLNHLTPLGKLEKFDALWLHLVRLLERFLHLERSDMLSDAVPESLKNMILVLDRTDVFSEIPDLRSRTVSMIKSFLPNLGEELERIEQVESKHQGPVVTELSEAPLLEANAQPHDIPVHVAVAPIVVEPSTIPVPEDQVPSSQPVEVTPTSPPRQTQPVEAVPISVGHTDVTISSPHELHDYPQSPREDQAGQPVFQQNQMTYEQQQQLYAQQYAAYQHQQYLQQQQQAQQYYQYNPETYLQQQPQQYYYSQYGSPQPNYAQPHPQSPPEALQQQPLNYAMNSTFNLVPSPTSAFSVPTGTTATNPIYTDQQNQGHHQQPQSPP